MNVKPGNLRDVRSEGLVLCASNEEHTGARVTLSSIPLCTALLGTLCCLRRRLLLPADACDLCVRPSAEVDFVHPPQGVPNGEKVTFTGYDGPVR